MKQKWSSLLARTSALILYISIWIFDFGSEKLSGLSRNGPLGKQHLRVPCQRVSWNSSIFEPCVSHYWQNIWEMLTANAQFRFYSQGYTGFHMTAMIKWGQQSKPTKIHWVSHKIPKNLWLRLFKHWIALSTG